MRSLFLLGAVAFVVTLLVVLSAPFARAQDPTHTEPGAPVKPSGESAEVLAQARGYDGWRRLAEYEGGATKSKGHGGAYVIAWANETRG